MSNTDHKIPVDCKLLCHETSTDGIIHILEDGGTKDTETLIKEIYSKRFIKDEHGYIHVNWCHGKSQYGPTIINGKYNYIKDLYLQCKTVLNKAPKGHYVYLHRSEWSKGLPHIQSKNVQIWYKYHVLDNFPQGSVKIRDIWDEEGPSDYQIIDGVKVEISDYKTDGEPKEGGEYIFPKGVNIDDWLCISVPSSYRNNKKYKSWSSKLCELCEKEDVKIYWTGESKDDTILDIYRKYTNYQKNRKRITILKT